MSELLLHFLHLVKYGLPRLFEWWLITGPFFGGLSTVLARHVRRRAWPWFLVGYGLNVVGVAIIAVVWLRERPRHHDEPEEFGP